MEKVVFGLPLIFWAQIAGAASVPLLIVAVFVRRSIQKRRFYSRPEFSEPIQGTLEELNAVDPNASPWTQDQRRKLADTKDLVGRYNTLDGYSEKYVDDLMAALRSNGIECDYVFQETLPMGVAAAIASRVGTFEVYADRSRVVDALKTIEEFKSR